MNPVGNVPVFLTFTQGQSTARRRETARRSVLTATGIAVTFALLGQLIFSIFGITLNAFRVAGGVLLFVIAFNLLQGKHSNVHHPGDADASAGDDVAIAPLGTPILAGPGTIATVMALSAERPVWSHTAITLSAFLVVAASTLVLFRYGTWIATRLGSTGINVVTRMMGLILTIIGVQMIAAGLTGLFPALVAVTHA
jgi:multiple antibiotic resistance protein